MSVKIHNIVDDETKDILCERCQEPFKEGSDELIIYGETLYHKKCWLMDCENK